MYLNIQKIYCLDKKKYKILKKNKQTYTLVGHQYFLKKWINAQNEYKKIFKQNQALFLVC